MHHISDGINSTHPNALLAGYESTVDSENDPWQYAILRGTPDGFRMLALVLVEMADKVDANGEDWHLALSPDDIAALLTANVRNLSLTCKVDNSEDIHYYNVVNSEQANYDG
ncbi:MAG: hypothetical protein AAF357_09635 [Verrucomicrobiota bacterium]